MRPASHLRTPGRALLRGARSRRRVPGMDITEVILEQHHEQRRAFAILDEMPREDRTALASVWGRLEVLLEVHAEAEERFFYPRLLQLGKGNPEGDVDEEVEDAIKDHNEIREAIRAVRRHE